MRNAFNLIVSVLLLALFACSNHKIKITASEGKSVPTTIMKPTLRVFLENSGSMNGYMCEGSRLKDIVFDYVGDLNALSSRTALYYINSDTIPFTGSFQSFIETMTPEHLKKSGGNHASSDIRKMLERVVDCVNDSTVCMFISDCILDLPVGDTQKFLNNCRISIKNTISNGRKRVPNLGVEILKMSSDFTGKYFFPNGKYEKLQNVKRPYYIWIMGDSRLLARYNAEKKLDELKKYGFEELVSFTPQIYATFDVSNRSTTSDVVTPNNGIYQATLRANFNETLQPEREILNPANYSFSNPEIRVERICRITAANSPYTHIVEFTIPISTRVLQSKLTFKVQPIPAWVESSHDENGTNILNNLNKTSGIKHQIEGVADAYRKGNIVTEFSVNIKRF